MASTVLIIDDEAAIRESLAGILEDEGFAPLSAASAEEGLQVLEEKDVGLVLLDIWMPGMDGIEVMNLIREQFPAMPVVVLTGHRDTETVRKMIGMGVSEYLTKPIHLETLLNQFVKDIIGPPA